MVRYRGSSASNTFVLLCSSVSLDATDLARPSDGAKFSQSTCFGSERSKDKRQPAYWSLLRPVANCSPRSPLLWLLSHDVPREEGQTGLTAQKGNGAGMPRRAGRLRRPCLRIRSESA